MIKRIKTIAPVIGKLMINCLETLTFQILIYFNLLADLKHCQLNENTLWEKNNRTVAEKYKREVETLRI